MNERVIYLIIGEPYFLYILTCLSKGCMYYEAFYYMQFKSSVVFYESFSYLVI